MTAKSTYQPFDDSVNIDPQYLALGASWRRALQSKNAAPHTIKTYMEAHRRFGLFLAQQGMPQRVRQIRREHVEAWMVAMLEADYKPSSVSNRYRGLRAWFHFLERDDEIDESPMRRMQAPTVPEEHKAILTDQQIEAILAACDGKTFADKRDLAMVTLLFDTGMRRQELAGIQRERLDLDEQFVVVAAKGRRDRVIAFGRRTVRVLDKYLRARATHPHAEDPHLFIGQRGPTTGDGVYQMLARRAAQAGVTGIHPHLFRHTYAHLFLEAGGQESDLMAQAGWRSPQMVRHYGAALREKRARESAKRLSPVDRRMTNH